MWLFKKFWITRHPKFDATQLQKFHIWCSFPCASASSYNLNNEKLSRLKILTCFLDSLVIHNCWKQPLLFTAKILSIICCLILLEGPISVYLIIWIWFAKLPFNASWNMNYLWCLFSPRLLKGNMCFLIKVSEWTCMSCNDTQGTFCSSCRIKLWCWHILHSSSRMARSFPSYFCCACLPRKKNEKKKKKDVSQCQWQQLSESRYLLKENELFSQEDQYKTPSDFHEAKINPNHSDSLTSGWGKRASPLF